MDLALKESGLSFNSDQMINFIRESIVQREFSKFIFTKSLSQVLKLMGNLGTKFNIPNDDMAHVNIHTILELYGNLDHRHLKDILEYDIQNGKSNYAITQYIKLPHIIIEPDNIYEFTLPKGKPNFITLNQVEANIILEQNFSEGIEGKIVFIESADPGYDWLFSKSPAGLITMYGGCNSHMAIRCAELGLPSVIGSGEGNFKKWNKA